MKRALTSRPVYPREDYERDLRHPRHGAGQEGVRQPRKGLMAQTPYSSPPTITGPEYTKWCATGALIFALIVVGFESSIRWINHQAEMASE